MSELEGDRYRDIAKTDVVFLGAGFSRAVTVGASPLMSDFFSDLDRREHWILWSFLEQLCDDPKSANVEDALLGLDQLATSPLEGMDPFFDQCRRRQQEVRKELDEYIIQRLGPLKISKDNWAASVFSRASDKTTVITTNYDTLTDRILSSRRGLRHRTPDTNCHHCKLCRILNEECNCGGDMNLDFPWQGSLLKLHGSISWSRCTKESCDARECLLPDQHCRPFADNICPSCGSRCSPVLVPPSMVKTFDRFRGLKQMWNAAYRALSEADSVIFWGFSFPKSDALITQMLRSALTGEDRVVDVAVIDVEPEKPASVLQDILGEKSQVTGTLFEVPNDGSKPKWLGEPSTARQ